ncbi:MAG: 16S rRNA (adenine(1518)-N(6)/adenine(1519)-N(6))-dimethyltransferase RsmA [Fimbriimonas sp.]|nr:16S rRNA (adenine(1518)-N(6)/adenine(1519)-N(6))-dimethyltransferase RsmA [Fimbriimonas sp.]
MNLSDPGTLKTFLARHGISASKGLGQHFLCSQKVVDKIANALAGCSGVCEIGPGPGVLTSRISAQCDRLIALEIDSRMVSILQESAPKAEVRQLDVLHADLAEILKELPEPRGVVSNLPYYITAPLLTKIAEACEKFTVAVLMMQKEVAQRVAAPAGHRERGSLSVYLQSRFEISLIAQVSAAAFVPPPKVDSTVLSFRPKPTGIEPSLEQDFYALVRFGFAQPRKTLANNLVAAYRRSREDILTVLETAGLEEKIRAHDLTQEHWASIQSALQGMPLG